MKKRKIVLCVMLAGMLIPVACGREPSEIELVAVDKSVKLGVENAERKESVQESEDVQISQNGQTAENGIYVFIYGAVEKPGVYELSAGARLYELVELAGGYTSQAMQDYQNLAREVQDGEQIYIPTTAEYEAYLSEESEKGTISNVTEERFWTSSSKKDTLGLVNINSASKEELMTISGIGESRAEDIISYRNQYGPFRSIEEIQQVSGIKSGIYQKIKDFITV